MEKFFKDFNLEFFLSISPSHMWLVLITLVGAVLGILIRKVYNGLKDYPTTWDGCGVLNNFYFYSVL
jgi:hypothetical protein